MKIALVQTNPLVGDFAAALRAMRHAMERAHAAACRLVIFPELALCGAPPADLLACPAFLAAHDRALQELLTDTRQFPDLSCVVGGLEHRGEAAAMALFNTAFVLENGSIQARAHKRLLLNGDVSNEPRHFTAGSRATIFPCARFFCALSIGSELGTILDEKAGRNPMENFTLGAVMPDLLINIAATPYAMGLRQERRRQFQAICTTCGLPLVHVGQAGGQGHLVYEGDSLFMDERGAIRAHARDFAADFVTVDFPERPGAALELPDDPTEELVHALCQGLADFLRKSGFDRVVLGLSGGIDSALTAALACRALGPDRVLGVALPSPYTARESIDDAKKLAENLGCAFACMPIQPAMDAMTATLAPRCGGLELPESLTGQNLQARIRGNLLMALANQERRLLLCTGNKSEIAVGYSTLYGDSCGALAVLGDVFKTEVYALARWLNREREIIPQNTIDRPPTAELKPGQRDEDDLPPYALLDQILRAYVEERQDIADIAARLRLDPALVQDVARRIRQSEYKRIQAAPCIRVSRKAFGPGRSMPLINGFIG